MAVTDPYAAYLKTLTDDQLVAEAAGKLAASRGASRSSPVWAARDSCWYECCDRGKRELFQQAVDRVNAEKRAADRANRKA